MGETLRKIKQVIEPQMVIEGAGVLLRRSFGPNRDNLLVPFYYSTILHLMTRLKAQFAAFQPIHTVGLKRSPICSKGMSATVIACKIPESSAPEGCNG